MVDDDVTNGVFDPNDADQVFMLGYITAYTNDNKGITLETAYALQRVF